MNIDQKLKKFVSLSTHVRELARPLEANGIIGFFYVRLYQNGEFSDLSSRPDWSIHYLQGLYSSRYQPEDMKDHLFLEHGVSLWEFNQHNPIWQDGKKVFGYGNGISICQDTEDYREVYSFYARSTDPKVNNFYINNIDYLKNFKSEFVNTGAPLIKQAEENRFILPEKHLNLVPKIQNDKPIVQNRLEKKPLIFTDNFGQPIALTKRELCCIKWLAIGKSSKEISQQLDISHRTVENYIAVIKTKLHCNKTSKLIYMALKLGIVNLDEVLP